MDCVVGRALVIKISRIDDLRVVQSQGYRVLLLARICSIHSIQLPDMHVAYQAVLSFPVTPTCPDAIGNCQPIFEKKP